MFVDGVVDDVGEVDRLEVALYNNWFMVSRDGQFNCSVDWVVV